MTQIAENIARIRAQMAEAARAAGRDPAEIQLCAATKMNDAEAVKEAVRSGVSVLATAHGRELETALRSKELSGFQILDLQDFPGQGTALVGVLNAFAAAICSGSVTSHLKGMNLSPRSFVRSKLRPIPITVAPFAT